MSNTTSNTHSINAATSSVEFIESSLARIVASVVLLEDSDDEMGTILNCWAAPYRKQAQAALDLRPRLPTANLDEVMHRVRATTGVPAVAGVVVSDEATLALGAAGLRKAGSSQIVQRRDKWHVGNCRKAVVATLVAKLVENDRFDFDDVPETGVEAFLEEISCIDDLIDGFLGMHSSRFGSAGVLDPWGHDDDGAPVPPTTAGGMHASLDDLARFAQVHLRALRGGPSSLKSLHDGSGAGWTVHVDPRLGGRVSCCHSGDGFFKATIWLLPNANRGVVTVVNQGGAAGERAIVAALNNLMDTYVLNDTLASLDHFRSLAGRRRKHRIKETT